MVKALVDGDTRLQVSVSECQLGLKERGLGIVHRSARRIEACLRLIVVWLGETLCRIEGFRSLEVLIGSGVLREGLVELGLRLRYLILQVFPANVCQSEVLFCIVSGSNVASSPIRSSHLPHIRHIAGGAKHEIYLRVRKNGR